MIPREREIESKRCLIVITLMAVIWLCDLMPINWIHLLTASFPSEHMNDSPQIPLHKLLLSWFVFLQWLHLCVIAMTDCRDVETTETRAASGVSTIEWKTMCLVCHMGCCKDSFTPALVHVSVFVWQHLRLLLCHSPSNIASFRAL